MTTMALTPAFPRSPRVDGAVVRQLARYGVVGVLGTAVSALLYLLFYLKEEVGLADPPTSRRWC